eukprot:6227699-Alexandrium_andersonii.AAC.1
MCIRDRVSGCGAAGEVNRGKAEGLPAGPDRAHSGNVPAGGHMSGDRAPRGRQDDGRATGPSRL